jgi:hypothetical protein
LIQSKDLEGIELKLQQVNAPGLKADPPTIDAPERGLMIAPDRFVQRSVKEHARLSSSSLKSARAGLKA